MHATAQNRALQFLTVSIVLCLGCLFAVAFCSNILYSSRIAQNCPLQFLTMFYSSLSKCLLTILLCHIFCTVPGLHKTVLCSSWPYLVLFTLSARYIVLQYIYPYSHWVVFRRMQLHKTVLCNSWPYLLLFTLSDCCIVLQYISLQSADRIQTHAVAQGRALQFLTVCSSLFTLFARYSILQQQSIQFPDCTKRFAIPHRASLSVDAGRRWQLSERWGIDLYEWSAGKTWRCWT